VWVKGEGGKRGALCQVGGKTGQLYKEEPKKGISLVFVSEGERTVSGLKETISGKHTLGFSELKTEPLGVYDS